MKQLQSLALILGIISALVHIYVLTSLLLDFRAELPKILWSLHIGVFICCIPAAITRIKRINILKDNNSTSLQDSNKAIWEGIPMFPFRMFWYYLLLIILYQAFIQSNDGTGLWLVLSGGWMMFYYLGWAMLRDEQTHKIAA